MGSAPVSGYQSRLHQLWSRTERTPTSDLSSLLTFFALASGQRITGMKWGKQEVG